MARKFSCRLINAHAMRAILLASANATSLRGVRASSLTSQGSRHACLPLSTDIAPLTSNLLEYPLPSLLISPSFILPAVPSWRGTRPSEAAGTRHDRNLTCDLTLTRITVAPWLE